jgi:hypothetical protein
MNVHGDNTSQPNLCGQVAHLLIVQSMRNVRQVGVQIPVTLFEHQINVKFAIVDGQRVRYAQQSGDFGDVRVRAAHSLDNIIMFVVL